MPFSLRTSPGYPLNAPLKVLTPEGSVMLVSFSHPANASSQIVVTLGGIVMLFRFLQPLNAPSPMVVKPSGSVTLVKFSHPENTLPPIWVTPFMMITLLRVLLLLKVAPSMTSLPVST